MWSESGIGRYIRNLVENLGEADRQNKYVLFLLKKNLNVIVPENFSKVEADIPWYGFSEQIKFPQIIKSQKVDLMHFPHFNVPVLYRGKFIVTIHDLIHQHFRMRRASTLNPLIYQIKHLSYKQVFYQSLKNSQKIITVSDYVKDCLKKEMSVPERKIIVTKEAAEERIITQSQKISSARIEETLKKLNIRTPFIFYIGNAHPHKNVEGLIKAFLILKDKFPDLQLVLAGNDHYFWGRIKKEFQNKDINYPGYITDDELICLYKSAEAFVMPSFEEGFGIPILESFACECPVISSNRASLPEVGGNACLYFDPSDISDITEKIAKVLDSQTIRNELIEKGLSRYRDFSWKKLADETMSVYNQIK